MIAAILLFVAAAGEAPPAPSPASFIVSGPDIDEAKFDADMQVLCYRDPQCLGANREARDRTLAAYEVADEKRRAKILKAIAINISGEVVNWRWVPTAAGLDPKVHPSPPYSSAYRRRISCYTHISKSGRHIYSSCW